MHLTGKHKINALGAGILLLGGMSYVGLRSLRSEASMSVAPLAAPSPAPADSTVPPAVKDRPAETTALPPTEAPKQVVVAMAGAVKTPGLLHLPLDARVDDAIKRAGGAKADADLETINLAAKLVDGDQVFVPAKKKEEPARVAEAERVAPKYRGGAVSPHYAPVVPDMPATIGGALPAGSLSVQPAHARAAKAKTSGPVSLNTGSEAQFETLPGVGPATAQKILDYRMEHGGFSSVEEITAVKGIGPKKFEKMKPFLKL